MFGFQLCYVGLLLDPRPFLSLKNVQTTKTITSKQTFLYDEPKTYQSRKFSLPIRHYLLWQVIFNDLEVD